MTKITSVQQVYDRMQDGSVDEGDLASDVTFLLARGDRLEGALRNLLQEYREVLGYVSAYHRKKWRYDEIIPTTQAILAAEE